MRFMIISGLTILLSGCATTTTNYYTPTIQSWQGSNVQALTKVWGQPDRHGITADGHQVLLYKTTNYRTYSDAMSPAVGFHVSPQANPVMVTQPNTNLAVPQRNITLNCAASFVANKQGTIVATQSIGNGCYANQTFAAQLSNPARK